VDATLDLGQSLDEIGRRLASIAESDDSPEAGTAEILLDSATILRDSFPKPPVDLVVRLRGLARPGINSWRLIATPVSPAADFQFEILDRATTLFGTSATVSVAGDARGALGALELAERAGSRYRLETPVESPFDYANNLKVVYINERTDRDTLVKNTVETIATLAERLGGRTMGLFTSRDRLSQAGDELFTRLMADGISVIAPAVGNADPHDLVRTFMETDQAVLLGARAFWQGVDVPGDACQAVVIEKLPFDVPGDPLIRRRSELIEREGGNAFMDYMLPRMLLRLKQMIGRLIRTPTDRGLVIIVEARCDKRYFPRLHDALPPNAGRARLRLEDLRNVVEDFASSL
jgi:Rad3-related DNA helicase